MGSNKNLIIYTNLSTLIESKNIYLGKKAFDNKSKGDRQSLVMGDELVTLLKELIDSIGQLFVGGTIGGVSMPINTSGSPGWVQLNAVKAKLQNILSKHHYVEKNTIGEK